MSMARRRRLHMKWRRYVDRYITPARGGMLDNAWPVGEVKASFRRYREKWLPRYPLLHRQGRRSR